MTGKQEIEGKFKDGGQEALENGMLLNLWCWRCGCETRGSVVTRKRISM